MAESERQEDSTEPPDWSDKSDWTDRDRAGAADDKKETGSREPFSFGSRETRACGVDKPSELQERAAGNPGSRDSAKPERLYTPAHDTEPEAKPIENTPGRCEREAPDGSVPGERTSDWLSHDILRVAGHQGAKDFCSDMIGGVSDFVHNYNEMKAANVKGADKYFHCMANCEATQRGAGGEAAATAIGYGREATDSIKNLFKGMSLKESLADCKDDLQANRVGRDGANAGTRCYDVCERYRVRGL
jgi:hypothetical protein